MNQEHSGRKKVKFHLFVFIFAHQGNTTGFEEFFFLNMFCVYFDVQLLTIAVGMQPNPNANYFAHITGTYAAVNYTTHSFCT